MAERGDEQRGSDPALRAAAGVSPDGLPPLVISHEKVCFIVAKVRQFDVKDLARIPDDGSDPPGEEMRSAVQDRRDDAVRQELAAFIAALNYDAQVDLVTLMWMGRGDGTIDN